MLSKLVIDNYALIDHLEIDFSEGFSVITGETGAGKSILLGALSLVLGNRCDVSVLLDKSRKCIVEGCFLITGYGLDDFFHQNEIDLDDQAILRREILQNGKSRAFINDTPVSAALLKDLGERLVNIHSQFSVITLNNADFQLAVLDSYSGNNTKVQAFSSDYSCYLKKKNERDELIRLELESRKEKDYNQFLFDELDAAKLEIGEQEKAEKQLELLTHTEEIKSGLLKSIEILTSGEQNITDQVSEIMNLSSSLSKYHQDLDEISERLKSNLIDLRDIAAGMQKIEQDTDIDPEDIIRLKSRLDLLYRLEKKHNADEVSSLIALHDELGRKLQDSASLEENISVLEKEIDEWLLKLRQKAEVISSVRVKSAPELAEKIRQILVRLGIEDARIKIEVVKLDELTPDGFDSVTFLFSANKGIDLAEISKIASGGELSRLMLAIKSLVSQKNLLPTIIFDEIDVGVSGEVAGKVGDILLGMGRTMQVIAITHLPQIAGKGHTHYWVYKTNANGTARTQMKSLDRKERVVEIAKMLSNDKVSDAAMATAKELLGK